MDREDLEACEAMRERVRLLRAESDDLGELLATMRIPKNRKLLMECNAMAMQQMADIVDAMALNRKARMEQLRELDAARGVKTPPPSAAPTPPPSGPGEGLETALPDKPAVAP